MASKLRRPFQKDSLVFDILKITATLAAGGTAVLLFSALPGLAPALAPFLKNDCNRVKRIREAERKRLNEAIHRLKRKRLIDIIVKDGQTGLKITKNGKETVKLFEFDELKLPQPEKWDGRWRVVTFDIPEYHKKGREALRVKLDNLGFKKLQKSVWVYPHECHDEIDFVTRMFEVEKYIQYLICESLDSSEIKFRKFFNLL